MDADVSQLRALSADLGKAGAGVTVKAGRAVRKAATDIEARAKAVAPVDTGFLRNSIGVTMTGALSAEVGPAASYGIYLEYGTYKMAPRPYMNPAADAVEPAFVAAIEQLGGVMLS